MNKKTYDPEMNTDQSITIIKQMILNAKTNVSDNGSGWLIWGSLIFLSSIATYFLIETDADITFMAWNIFGIIAIVLLAYQALRPRKKQMKTYVEEVLQYVDWGFFACLILIIFSMNFSVSPNVGFGYLLMIYGFLMLIEGGALRFRPLMIGALVNWAGAIAIFLNTVFKYDMLITAAAVLIGYIIPGLMLRAKYKKNNAFN